LIKNLVTLIETGEYKQSSPMVKELGDNVGRKVVLEIVRFF
jgi:hypothetical protein